MSGLTGTGVVLRLALRRDRIQLPVWALGLTGVVAASASSVQGLYDTEAARLSYAATAATSVVARAFNGPPAGPDLGAIVATETFVTTSLLVALMSIFAVVRHTRQNEETGRAELLASGVLGRYAMVTAAVTIAVLANGVLGVLIFGVLLGLGLPAAGSALFAAGTVAAGMVFAAVAAVTAQIAESARAANGLASAVLGLAFLARAAGDAMGEVSANGLSAVSAWPSWLSPLGWAQRTRPFGVQDAWPLGLLLALFLVLGAVAYRLVTHRDLGTGMLPVRPGPPRAARRLLSPLGLAWRLQRGPLYGWGVGLIVTGLAMGGVANEINKFVAGNEQMAEMLRQLGGPGELVDVYFAGVIGLFAIAVAGYIVQALLRLRSEESEGRLEPVLGAAVSRSRWLLSHVTWAVLGSGLLLLVLGAATGLTYGLVTDDVVAKTVRLAGAAVIWWPATLALGAVVVALFSIVPRLTIALSWSVLTVCLLMGQIGALLDLPQAVLNISPFTHVPAVPAADFAALPLVLLTTAAFALAAAGLVSFRRRDLAM